MQSLMMWEDKGLLQLLLVLLVSCVSLHTAVLLCPHSTIFFVCMCVCTVVCPHVCPRVSALYSWVSALYCWVSTLYCWVSTLYCCVSALLCVRMCVRGCLHSTLGCLHSTVGCPHSTVGCSHSTVVSLHCCVSALLCVCTSCMLSHSGAMPHTLYLLKFIHEECARVLKIFISHNNQCLLHSLIFFAGTALWYNGILEENDLLLGR